MIRYAKALAAIAGLFASVANAQTAKGCLTDTLPSYSEANIVNVSTVGELNIAEDNQVAGQTIVLAAGTYDLTETFSPTVDNLTIVGDPNSACSEIVLRGKGMDNANHGGVTNLIYIGGVSNTKVFNLTLRDPYNHAISINHDADSPHIANVRFLNCGEQCIKSNPQTTGDPASAGADNGIVEFSVFQYLNGTPTTDHGGGGTGYTNCIDVQAGDGWIFRDNWAKDFFTPDTADNLWGPCVQFWRGTDNVTITRNTIINSSRAISVGFEDQTSPAVDANTASITNNFIYNEPDLFSAQRTTDSDALIYIADGANVDVIHNSILTYGNTNYSIQYRFDGATGDVRNNYVDAPIRTDREGANATAANNIFNLSAAYVRRASIGDLHLRSTAPGINSVPYNAQSPTDYDGETRPSGGNVDAGADEYIDQLATITGGTLALNDCNGSFQTGPCTSSSSSSSSSTGGTSSSSSSTGGPPGPLDGYPLATYSDVFGNYLGGFNIQYAGPSTDQLGNQAAAQYTDDVFAISNDFTKIYYSGWDHGHNSCSLKDALAVFQVPALTLPPVLSTGQKYPNTDFFNDTTGMLQSWFSPFPVVPLPDDCLSRYTGFWVRPGATQTSDAELWAFGTREYPAYGGTQGELQDNLVVIRDPSNLLTSTIDGNFKFGSNAKTGAFFHGWAGQVPAHLQGHLGGTHFAGGSHVASIIGRSSTGPTLGVFDVDDFPSTISTTSRFFPIDIKMEFPFGNELGAGEPFTSAEWMAATGATFNKANCDASSWEACITVEPTPWDQVVPCNGTNCPIPIFNWVSRVHSCFFVPGSRTYACVGQHSCSESGCPYKPIRPGFTASCSGEKPVDPADTTGYYWFFDVQEILSAENKYDPRPYAHGEIEELNDYIEVLNPASNCADTRGNPAAGYYHYNTNRICLSLDKMREGDDNSPAAIVCWQVNDLSN